MSAALAVYGTIAAIGFLTKAIPAFIPDKERREELEKKDKEREEGLSKSEEKELAALLSAQQAGMTKVALDSIQSSMAGAGMLSPGAALLTEKIALESTQAAGAQVGRQVAAADEAARQAAEVQYQQLRAEEDAWEANRRAVGFGAAGDVMMAAGTGGMMGSTPASGEPVTGEFDWTRAGKGALGSLQATGALRAPPLTPYGTLGGAAGTPFMPDTSALTPEQKARYDELLLNNPDLTPLKAYTIAGGQA